MAHIRTVLAASGLLHADETPARAGAALACNDFATAMHVGGRSAADFAVIWSYLATATKHGIDHLDALTQLFTSGPWLPRGPAAA